MAGPLDDSDTRNAVQAALGAEHAAVWSCGLASAYLAPGDQGTLSESALAHRERRDSLVALCEAGEVAPVAAAAAYATPRPVNDAASAAALLVVAEDDCAVAWRAVLERTDDAGLRKSGVAAVVSSATVGVRWRQVSGTQPVVPTFPGTR
ncbi:ferritin-like domain-containing protein [Actinomycetospora endophytica]|uniref:Ferritin-like domain-containing protein n=1 Tax=Actinomycetospora endophytica TaxID=2291215 RepID=A0ABS8PG38_9PSEU|nr:ferritin-like domain-containing protein [Actinomycetospora endophytica]MCD2197193.1 ferritin-like domain-containing protein [Actinomycetospora endophytica]